MLGPVSDIPLRLSRPRTSEFRLSSTFVSPLIVKSEICIPSVVLWRKLIVDVPNQRHSHLCAVVTPQNVADKVRLDLHLNHFQSTSKNSTEYVGIPEFILRSAIVGKLHEIRKWVLVKYQRELVIIGRPVGDLRCDV